MIDRFTHVDIEEFFHDVYILMFNKGLFTKSLFESGLLDFRFEGFIGLMFGYSKLGIGDFIVMNLLFSSLVKVVPKMLIMLECFIHLINRIFL